MRDVNVGGTERVLDAAIESGVERIVYVSTVNIFGNTKGRVVDETYERPLDEGFVSVYDETKYAAHQVAVERIERGAPIVLVQPGAVYGPGDESQLGEQLRLAQRGKLRYVTLGEIGFTAVHVDDVVDGLVLALDQGRIGESYVLGGEPTTMKQAVAVAARITGKKPPKLAIPTTVIRMMAPFGRVMGPLLGQPPNLREVISASHGVTYWATHAKASGSWVRAPRSRNLALRHCGTDLDRPGFHLDR